MQWIEAAFVRGGTSKGLFFAEDWLPEGREARDRVFAAALGSPDRFGRQLDGMGGGISSLSKVMVVSRSQREGVDLDYTFGQVAVDTGVTDYAGNCGNLSSGVVPFALEAGLLQATEGHQDFTLFNTNTNKIVQVSLPVIQGSAAVADELSLPGVHGTGAPIELRYPDPSGSRSAGLLPTGNPADLLQVDGQEYPVTLVDAALPTVIIEASKLGLEGTESPEQIDADKTVMELLEKIRRAGAVAMGLCAAPEEAALVMPKIMLAAAPAPATLLDGSLSPAEDCDLLARVISMGQTHKAVPGTGAMCLAAAAQIPGSIAATLAGPGNSDVIRLGTPSGAVSAAAHFNYAGQLEHTSLLRTARILMKGFVQLPR
ncbi:PrpF domain-containing protein [Glutamicibacter nicotianae]|uniref:PrpF domain-containing protein n=1 Tax=Glutamicibacter nicotianae TaxID=37929 RepID=UPI00167F5A5D|nr:PrpF domain-containing protein [Glutamicibacter nicotianae]